MSLQRTLSAFGLAAFVGACGCSQARYVTRSPEGGVVAIPKNNDYWPTHYRSEAEKLMRECCPEGYVIVAEKEAVIGHTTTTNATNDNRVASSVTESRDVTEWHIHFRSKNALVEGPVVRRPPPPAPAVVPASHTLPAEPVPVTGQ